MADGVTGSGHRWSGIRDADFRATDVADRLLVCSCGRPECAVSMQRPLRDHIAILYRAILSCGFNELLPGVERQDPWPGVTYALAMAASVENVYADPYHVDDSQAGLWCGTAWDREEEDRATASRYVAALSIFNFVWLAYEAAIERVVGSAGAGDRLPVRARKLFQAEAPEQCAPAIRMMYAGSRRLCRGTGALERDIAAIESRYGLSGAAAAAELGRLFRNYIVHGDDPVPIDGLCDFQPIFRFYAVAKLLLLLVQLLALGSLSDPGAVIALSVNKDDERERAGWLLSNLHLVDGRWRHLDPLGPSADGHVGG